MTTTLPKKNLIKHDWIEIDAAGKTLGRVATLAASRLCGKHKVIYTPHMDTGDYVVVTNAREIRLTGRKATDKEWQRHSGHPGGLRRTPYGELLEKNPRKLVELAVRRMLPKNRLGRRLFTKLKVYAESTHPHAGQRPKKVEAR